MSGTAGPPQILKVHFWQAVPHRRNPDNDRAREISSRRDQMQTRTAFLALATELAAADAPPRMPIPNNYQDSSLTKWLANPVLASELLDDAESLANWNLVDVDQAQAK